MKTKFFANHRTVLSGYILIPTIEFDYINWPDSHKTFSITMAWLRLSLAIYFYWDYQY